MSEIELRLEDLEIEMEKLRDDFENRSICEKMKDYIFIWIVNKRQQWSKCQ